MSQVQWDDFYSVEIQEIDEQHKCLIKLMNQLDEVLNKTFDYDKIDDVLNQLVEYTKIHFAVEETLMRLFDYEEYESHKAIHDKIATQVIDYQDRFRAGERGVGVDLLRFLKDWLFEHINTVDKRYSKNFINGGAKKSWLKKFF